MKKLAVSSTLFLSIALVLCGDVFGQVEMMKLLTPDVGWAANGLHLVWTTNGGVEWKEITPKMPVSSEHIAAVFFLDTSTGWVLWSKYAEPQPRLDISLTNDAGASWTNVHIPIIVRPEAVALSEGGQMFFLDELHGWVNIDVQSSASAHRGAMLMTRDGGRTWDWMGMDSRGVIYFATPNNGWVVSPEGDELDVTHDGGDTWQDVTLTPPQEVRRLLPAWQPNNMATYHLPGFHDRMRGYVEVGFHDGSNDVRALFSTGDGGRTWKFERTLPKVRYAATQLLSNLWIAASDSAPGSESSVPGKTLFLTSLPLNGSQPEAPPMQSDISRYSDTSKYEGLHGLGHSEEISFSDPMHGWALPGELLATADGGATWTDVTPPQLSHPRGPTRDKSGTDGTCPNFFSPNPGIATQKFSFCL